MVILRESYGLQTKASNRTSQLLLEGVSNKGFTNEQLEAQEMKTMGILCNHAVFMARAKRNNVCFDKILTIGHQTLYISQKQIKRLAKCYRVNIDKSSFLHKQYADKFFEMFLDAKSVMSLDCSDHEDCDIIHDMNQPIDPSYHEKFDVVIDGGSLEHIFNFPVAVANCMKMLKKGGSIFMFSGANNHMGHGFYQFSPELFFRIFRPENGFVIRDVILGEHPFPGAELSPKIKHYSVVDPAVVKSRVGLVSKTPVLIMVHAIRTEIKAVFAHYPIQSGYSAECDGNVRNVSARRTNAYASIKRLVRSFCPLKCRYYIRGKRQLWNCSFSNRRVYKRYSV